MNRRAKGEYRLVVCCLTLLGLWLGCALGVQAQTRTIHLYYTDPQGTVLAKTDAQGNIIARYDYTPYGNSVASLGSPPNGPGYTGHVNDPETGLVYMQQRYYQPDGRFLSPDPMSPKAGDLSSFNRYAYANNNPINHTDPDGRCVEDACIVEGGVAVGAGVVYVGAAALVAAGVCVEACGKAQHAISNAAKSIYEHVVQESRSKPPAPLPEAGGRPHSIPDGNGGYTTYPSGKSTEGKQYRPTGKSHGDIPRPNVKEWKPNVAPDGTEYPGKGEVRPPEPREIPSQSPQPPPTLPKTDEGGEK